MASHLGQYVRHFVVMAAITIIAACTSSTPSGAAPYAAYVMDARTGEVLYSRNAEARLHPASLTKMMTLYIAFEAIERGEISLDTMVTVSKNAAGEAPSRLGLKAGQKIALRYLIRAAAIKSANDAATAIGEAIGGSETQFAARMNRTAKALGMTNSTFVNANGLTVSGHLSTARDMSVLGRRLFYDFPQYYNIFSRRSTDAGLAQVANTNRRFLDAYKGADGIKTGFTNAAGFNLTASAERGNVRIIATVFGGTSTAQRNAKMAELLDLGFKAAKPGAKPQPPAAPNYENAPDMLVAEAEAAGQPVMAAKTLRVVTAVSKSLVPKARPGSPIATTPEVTVADVSASEDPIAEAVAAEVAVASMQDSIFGALAEATGAEAPAMQLAAAPASGTETGPDLAAVATALADTPRASDLVIADDSVVTLAAAMLPPAPRPAQPVPKPEPTIIHTSSQTTAAEIAAAVPTDPEVVTRISTSGGRHWGVNIGRFPSRSHAERALMQTMLSESATLNDGLRKIVQRSGGYDANFMGLSQDQADLACRRLQARGTQCFAIGP